MVAGLRALVYIFSCLLIGCAAPSDDRVEIASPDLSCRFLPGETDTLPARVVGRQYFPQSFGEPHQACLWGSFRCYPAVNYIENGWYPRIWDAAGEPSLFQNARIMHRARTTLRFTWIRTFDEPVVVRVERNGDTYRLEARLLSGEGGYDPGEIEQSVSRILSASEIRQLETILASTQVLYQPPTTCDFGLDGAQWIIESARQGEYRYINRWSPDAGPVRRVGMFLLGLTDWRFSEIY